MEDNEIDRSNALGIIESFPGQIGESLNFGKLVKVEESFSRVTVCGVGGSSVSGDILKIYLEHIMHVSVDRDFDLPDYVNGDTLVFALSYSGNTEETISSYRGAVKKKLPVVCITSGGKLKELADMNRTPCIIIPKGLQPRQALAYLFFPMLTVLHNCNVIKSPDDEIKKTLRALEGTDFNEKAKELAEKISGKVPLIYASKKMGVVAYRWKTQLNENSKIHAFCNVFPEICHNEIAGYEVLNSRYHVVIIKDEDDDPRIKKRMDITKRMLAELGIDVTELMIRGNCEMTKLFSTIYLGDLVSYYLAIRNSVDPTPVDSIESIKKEIALR